MNLKDYIATIENYPTEGIIFRDISPLMADGNAYSYAVREIVQYATDKEIDMIVGPEARGFIVGCPVGRRYSNYACGCNQTWSTRSDCR